MYRYHAVDLLLLAEIILTSKTPGSDENLNSKLAHSRNQSSCRQAKAGRTKTISKIGPRYGRLARPCLLVVAVTHHQGHSSVQVINTVEAEAAAAVDTNSIFQILKGTKANDMMVVVIDTGAPNQDTTIFIPGIAHRLLIPATAGVSGLSGVVLDNKMVCVRIMGVNKIPTTALCHHSGAGQYPPIPMIIAHPRTG